MDIDFKRLTSLLNNTTIKIKAASELVQKNPVEAMNFVGPIMENIEELASMGNLSQFTATEGSPVQKSEVCGAIRSLLENTKVAQEKAGVMGASLFSNPKVREVFANLEQVKTSLERGRRVEGTEEEQGI